MSINSSFVFDGGVHYDDSPSLDAFGRLRISEPSFVFDAQFTYGLQDLLYEQITAESGATVTHDSTNRAALMTFASTPINGKAYMQSYANLIYQAGRSQLITISFNFVAAVTNVLKFAGYSDGTNGIEFRLSGSTKQIAILSATSAGNQTIDQTNWNLDKLDGTGKSGITLDITKEQILVIDFQALYSGRVRVGFYFSGVIVYAHQFLHSNLIAFPYIQNANLPIRCGMTCSATVSTTMLFTCASVSGESSSLDELGFSFSQEGTVTASSGARTHILSVRPKTTFNSIVNRTRFNLRSIKGLVTGNNPILWELVVGQAISGTTTFNDVNATYSAMEFNTAGTISGSPAIVLSSGYIAASAVNSGQIERALSIKNPITLNAAGAVRSLGTLSLIVTGIGATSACRMSMDWEEIR